MAEHRVKQGELMFSPERRTQLEQISVSSVRRMTQGLERDLPRRLPRGGPCWAAATWSWKTPFSAS